MKAPLLPQLITISLFIHHSTGYYVENKNETDSQQARRLEGTYYESTTASSEGLSGGAYSSILRVPHQAQLCKGYLVHCGAVIISANWLLSAAHCFDRHIPELKVITGSERSCGGEERHTIERYIVHSDYNSKTLNNDISLIKLYKPIQFSNFQKSIKIARKGPQPGVMMLFSGYGYEEVNQGQAPSLKIARIPVLQQRKCKALYEKSGDKVADTSFCAGGGVETACFGDSGGPGVVGGRLAGIVSAGRDCGSPSFPSLFTRVSLFQEWIHLHTGIQV